MTPGPWQYESDFYPLEAAGLFGRISRALRGKKNEASEALANPGPHLHVAAFGKHGGAEDHDEIGVSTDPLTSVKRALYTNGIAGNLDSDEWAGLSRDERLPAFGHEFLWDRNSWLHCGRIWPSRDAKGRERYPMVACVQTGGLPRRWVLETVPPALERLELDFQYVTSPDAARSLVADTQQSLWTAAQALPPLKNASESEADSASAYELLAAHPDLGPDGRGLLHLLYAIDREFVGFRPDDAQTSYTTILRLSRHLRVPACGVVPAVRSCELWIAALRPLLLSSASILTVRPLGREWVDVIVGEPTRDEIYPLLTTRRKVPLNSDIPYTLEPAFIAQAMRRIAELRGKGN